MWIESEILRGAHFNVAKQHHQTNSNVANNTRQVNITNETHNTSPIFFKW